jgi:hypothetical protein
MYWSMALGTDTLSLKAPGTTEAPLCKAAQDQLIAFKATLLRRLREATSV